jgi:hypothetical protein
MFFSFIYIIFDFANLGSAEIASVIFLKYISQYTLLKFIQVSTMGTPKAPWKKSIEANFLTKS